MLNQYTYNKICRKVRSILSQISNIILKKERYINDSWRSESIKQEENNHINSRAM